MRAALMPTVTLHLSRRSAVSRLKVAYRPIRMLRLCNWSADRITYKKAGGIGCSLIGGLPALHVNTTLLILMSALCADARLRSASPARTKRQARERAARCASRAIRGGGFERGSRYKQLHRRRTMLKPARRIYLWAPPRPIRVSSPFEIGRGHLSGEPSPA